MKVALSPIVSDARGTTGFVTIQNTPAGLILRTTVTPFDPGTPAQQLARQSLATISQIWKSPSMNANRAAWVLLAAANPYTDVFGVQHKMSGLAFFTKLNRNLATLGISEYLVAPSTLSCGAPGLITISHTLTPSPTLTLNAAVQPASSENVVIRATKPLSPGVLSFGNTQTVIQTFTIGNPPDWDIYTAYHKKHATIAAGSLIFLIVNYVNTSTGFAGAQSIASLNW